MMCSVGGVVASPDGGSSLVSLTFTILGLISVENKLKNIYLENKKK
jgi:hypothetical protein